MLGAVCWGSLNRNGSGQGSSTWKNGWPKYCCANDSGMVPRLKRRRSQPDAESDRCAGTWGQLSCINLGALDNMRQMPIPWQYLLGVPKMTSTAVSEI